MNPRHLVIIEIAVLSVLLIGSFPLFESFVAKNSPYSTQAVARLFILSLVVNASFVYLYLTDWAWNKYKRSKERCEQVNK